MSVRAWSLAFSALSVVLPAIVLVRARRYVAVNYETVGSPIEGKAVASGFMLLVPASVLLCLIGLGLGAFAYRRLPLPRPGLRVLELTLQALPLLLWVLLAELLFLWVRGP